MSSGAQRKSSIDQWRDGLDKATGNRKWEAYDCEIRAIVAEYNSHLQATPGYRPLDWRLIKAMIWTETGAGSPEWKIKPMQIGVPGDPGMNSLLSGNEGADLILPPGSKGRMTAGTIRSIPAHNLRAGVGYLLMKMAYYEYQSLIPTGAPIQEVAVKSGDTMEKIAKTNSSTTEILAKLNPDAKILRVGQLLKLQPGTVNRVITGWRPMIPATIAQRYNGGGDPTYASKLDYALTVVRKGKDAACG
jgi:hypothetical protein